MTHDLWAIFASEFGPTLRPHTSLARRALGRVEHRVSSPPIVAVYSGVERPIITPTLVLTRLLQRAP